MPSWLGPFHGEARTPMSTKSSQMSRMSIKAEKVVAFLFISWLASLAGEQGPWPEVHTRASTPQRRLPHQRHYGILFSPDRALHPLLSPSFHRHRPEWEIRLPPCCR